MKKLIRVTDCTKGSSRSTVAWFDEDQATLLLDALIEFDEGSAKLETMKLWETPKGSLIRHAEVEGRKVDGYKDYDILPLDFALRTLMDYSDYLTKEGQAFFEKRAKEL